MAAVSVSTPAYFYNVATQTSGTVTSSVALPQLLTAAQLKAIAAASGTKTTSSTGTTTSSSTGTTGTTTASTTTSSSTTTALPAGFPAFGSTTTVYAAIRTDGVAGSGTKQNPYDASTQAKFDAILANLLKGNGAMRTTLTLGAGTYTVTPVLDSNYRPNIPQNLEIVGAGVDKTIIRAGIVPTGNSTYWVLAASGTLHGNYYESLTIDCNIQNQTVPKLTINGIESLHVAGGATQTLVSNVHVIDGGNRAGDPGDSEWFGITISDYQTGSLCVINGCTVDHYQGTSGCTALRATTAITNNSVTLNNADPYGLLGHGIVGGFQDAFSPAATVSGNTCHQCDWGVYDDENSATSENIENNVLDTLYGGVWIYTWSATTTLQKIYVHNNTITKVYDAAIIIGNAATSAVNSDLYAYNNTIITNAPSTSLATNNTIYLVAARNSEVYGNTFSVTPSSKMLTIPTFSAMTNSNLGTIAWFNNKFSNGTVIPGPAGTVAHALSGASVPAN